MSRSARGGATSGKQNKASTDVKEEGDALITPTTQEEENVLAAAVSEPADASAQDKLKILSEVNLFAGLSEEEYRRTLRALIVYVKPSLFDCIGASNLGDYDAIAESYQNFCPFVDLSSNRRDLLRLYRMGVRPQLLKEVPGTIVETSGSEPSDTSEKLLALLIPRLGANGHIWEGRVTAGQATSSHSTPRVLEVPVSVQEAAHTEAEDDSAEEDEAYIVPVVQQSRVPRSRSDAPAVAGANPSERPKKQRKVRNCTQPGYEDYADLRIGDLVWCTRKAVKYVQRYYMQHIAGKIRNGQEYWPLESRTTTAVLDRATSKWQTFKALAEQGLDWCAYGKQLAGAPLTATSTVFGLMTWRDRQSRSYDEDLRNQSRFLCIPNAGRGANTLEDPLKFRVDSFDNPRIFKQQAGTIADNIRRQFNTQFEMISTTLDYIVQRIDDMIWEAKQRVEFESPQKCYLSWSFDDADWNPKFDPCVDDTRDDNMMDMAEEGTVIRGHWTRAELQTPPRSDSSGASDQSITPDSAAAGGQRVAQGLPGASPSVSVSSTTSSVISEIDWETPFLQQFPTCSTLTPHAVHKVDLRRWDNLLQQHLMVLRDLSVPAVIAFVTSLMKINSIIPNGSVPWAGHIEITILMSLRSMLIKVTGRDVHNYFQDVSMREMVVALGRSVEVKRWDSFVASARPCFSDIVFDDSVTTAQQFWSQLNAILFRLSIVIPLVGRQLHVSGATLYHRQSHLAVLLSKLVPEDLLRPLLERLYSPESKDMNAARGLHREASEWKWKDVSLVMQLLSSHATMLADEQRDSAMAALEFNRLFSKAGIPNSKSKTHSIQYESSDDDSYSDDVSPGFHSMRPPGPGTARHKAYGASGSGQPSPMLEARIQKSTRQHESGRFDKPMDTSKEPCFTFAIKGSCPKRDMCPYAHPILDATQSKLVEFLRHKLEKASASTHGLEVSFSEQLETTSESPGSLSEISQALSGVKLD